MRIGITGHRRIYKPEKVIEVLTNAIGQWPARLQSGPFIVLSSLAEGADQLIAGYILKFFQSKLIVPLPLPVDDYLQDFKSQKARDSFLHLFNLAAETYASAQSNHRPECYLEAGRYIVENCDLLIAVWNGLPARGVGGTAEIVSLARARKLPICWVRVGREGLSEPKITLENFNPQG